MGLLVGFVMGIGAGLYAANVKIAQRREGGTLLANGIKGAVLASERIRELAARAKEVMEDAAAEAKAELARRRDAGSSKSELEPVPEVEPAKETSTP